MHKRISGSNATLLFATLIILCWLPAVTLAAEAAGIVNSPLTQNAIYYKNEYITVLSTVTLLIGAFLATRVEPPADLVLKLQITSAWSRFWFGIAGGLISYLYMLDRNNSLIVLHPAYVFGVALVTPLAIQIAYPFLLGAYQRMLKVVTAFKGDTGNDGN